MREALPTTHPDVLLKIVRRSGINEEGFLRHYHEGSAERALQEDLAMTRRLGIISLPAYRIEYRGRSLLFQSFDCRDFVQAIEQLRH